MLIHTGGHVHLDPPPYRRPHATTSARADPTHLDLGSARRLNPVATMAAHLSHSLVPPSPGCSVARQTSGRAPLPTGSLSLRVGVPLPLPARMEARRRR